MPDFELQIKWSCDSSWIPFLKNFCPSENYWILKRGTEWRLCNGSYPAESTMRPTHDCSQSLIFSHQPSQKDEDKLEHTLLSFDFESGLYADLYDKNLYSDEYWL